MELISPIGLQFISLTQEIEQIVGVAVDVITAKQAETLDMKFGYDILRKARIVYDRVTGQYWGTGPTVPR